MKTFLIAIVIAILLLGCAKEGTPTKVEQSGKDDFNVVFLFEKDGVKIYRFIDAGYYRYFSTDGFLPQTQQSTYTDGETTWTDYWEDGATSLKTNLRDLAFEADQ